MDGSVVVSQFPKFDKEKVLAQNQSWRHIHSVGCQIALSLCAKNWYPCLSAGDMG